MLKVSLGWKISFSIELKIDIKLVVWMTELWPVLESAEMKLSWWTCQINFRQLSYSCVHDILKSEKYQVF